MWKAFLIGFSLIVYRTAVIRWAVWYMFPNVEQVGRKAVMSTVGVLVTLYPAYFYQPFFRASALADIMVLKLVFALDGWKPIYLAMVEGLAVGIPVYLLHLAVEAGVL